MLESATAVSGLDRDSLPLIDAEGRLSLLSSPSYLAAASTTVRTIMRLCVCMWRGRQRIRLIQERTTIIITVKKLIAMVVSDD
jgi:hypothetical protein